MIELDAFQGIWTPTPKCFKKLGIDFEEIIALQQSELRTLIAEELSFVSVLLKSGLYIERDIFKLRFANPKSGKLKTIRKGFFYDVALDKKQRTVLLFEDTDGTQGRFVYKKEKLVDKDSPMEFKRISKP